MATSTRTVAPPGAESTGSITIVSIPASHPYVRQTTSDPRVTVLPDPVAPGGDPAVWWPPAALDPDWIRAHADEASLLHIHFGTESFPAGHLTACVAAAHAVGWPVVYTLHDLEHPQLGDSTAYLAQLDEVVTGADVVTTLTVGAARAVRERWGRHATVIPHPSVLPRDAAIEPAVGAGRIVGLHLKDLRPSVDGPGSVRTLDAALRALRDAGHDVRGEVRLHHRVRDADAAAEVRALCAASAVLDLVEHERLADADLFAALARLDACVLPYRHGTHSGWLELCWDLGVPVAAPRVGFLAEQHADGTVGSFAPGDAGELAAVLSDLWVAPSSRPASPARDALVDERRASRTVTDAAIAQRHADLYLHLLESRTA
ncbi:glycosyltransferase [Microbacterium oleivorans]|uniref:glycosyltransferase n=1 Tax=Microbacterium oleivorans TaxID=273677 RepID=UPI00203F23F6|nr:hypothetical protein [Microbacterium oleivorans]MCM3695300.1 hypothetical protein [Microbacterium oleivorans]